MLTNDIALRVRQAARVAAYHHTPLLLTYENVAKEVALAGLRNLRPRFIAEQAELAGFPVWTSAPDEAINPRA